MVKKKSSSKSNNNDTRKLPAAVASPINFLDNEDSPARAVAIASTLTSSVVDVHPDAARHPIEHPSDLGGALGAAGQREAHARAFAIDATKDADDAESGVLALRAKHKKIFLMTAFGINPDGTKITDRTLVPETIPRYRSVKTVEQYEEMIYILSNWGDDDELALLPRDDPEYIRIIKFRKKNNKKGYNYASEYRVDIIENRDGSEKKLLVQKKSNKVVSHMLNVYDAIWEAHARIGHLGHDKTHDACMETHYSPTQQLVKIFCQGCFICLEKQPTIRPHKGAKKPIISSNFRDRFQVDLIDMRSIRKEDVYGQMMRWIMTVKDHSTGLIWLSALPYKRAAFVAHELEKYFGLVGYPQIFHTGTFSRR